VFFRKGVFGDQFAPFLQRRRIDRLIESELLAANFRNPVHDLYAPQTAFHDRVAAVDVGGDIFETCVRQRGAQRANRQLRGTADAAKQDDVDSQSASKKRRQMMKFANISLSVMSS
jgi:hypothetical protein